MSPPPGSFREEVGRWREAFRYVNREPGPDGDGRARLVHHGLRALVLLAIAASLPALFPREPVPRFADLEEGMVAEEDVIAEVAFPVLKPAERLEEERAAASSGIAPIFAYTPSVADSAIDRVREMFSALEEGEAAEERSGLMAAAAEYRIDLSRDGADYLTEAGARRGLLAAVEEAYRSVLAGGVAASADIREVQGGRVVVRGPEGDRVLDRDSVVSAGAFYRRAAEMAPPGFSATALQLYQTFLIRFMEPSLRLDSDATRMARERAREAVEPASGSVLAGERIVAAHERVGPTEMNRLRSYQTELSRRGMGTEAGGFLRSLGGGLYGLVPLLVLGLALFLFRRRVYADVRNFSLVTGLTFLTLGVAAVIANAGAPPILIPVAFAALLVGALFDGFLALIAVMIVSVLLAGQPPFSDFTVPFLVVAGGGAAALGVWGVRRRADSWILIALITAGYLAAGTAITLMNSLPVGDLMSMVLWGGVTATVCTVFAMGAVLPALESFTGITTDQTLLELADLNRPLLRRLSQEAPGTYAHSINMANMAEAACEAIGASALLARVGVYYHDIGKMSRPQFFIENQPKGRNPHDRIQASRSAEVIREHVRAGIEMAREARLPRAIEDFIREHHGTQSISFFLEKARRQEPDLKLNPGEFAYPGPKPQSKETAVVMLADGVESATRALKDPTPERIRKVIDGIVRARIDEGQLDQCDLTLRDLDRVKSRFARVLRGMYHHRVDYPNSAVPEDEDRRAEAGRPGIATGAGSG